MIDTRAIWIYLGVFGALLASGMGLPVPEELWVVGAGASSRHPPHADPPIDLAWWIMLPTCIFGVVAGDCFLYTVGRLWGHKLLDRKWVQRWILPPAKRERIQRNFRRYGVWILLGARLLPGIRSPIFLMAGMNHMPVTKFLLADGLYAIPGVSMLFFLAYVFTDQFVDLVKKADKAKPIIILCVIAAVGGYLIYYFFKHPVAEGDPKDVPIIGPQIMSHMKDPNGITAEKQEPS